MSDFWNTSRGMEIRLQHAPSKPGPLGPWLQVIFRNEQEKEKKIPEPQRVKQQPWILF